MQWAGNALAHSKQDPSVHDVIASIIDRLRVTQTPTELMNLTSDSLVSYLTEVEKSVLSTAHIQFTLNVPAQLWLLIDESAASEPFWLKDAGFVRTQQLFKEDPFVYRVWEKDAGPGRVRLGVNGFSAQHNHYLVALSAQNSRDTVTVSDLYPKYLRLASWKDGVRPHTDEDDIVRKVPQFLQGKVLVQTRFSSRKHSQLLERFRITDYPSQAKPDQVVLTYHADPAVSQAITWRTQAAVSRGQAVYTKAQLGVKPSMAEAKWVKAKTARIDSPYVVNDPVSHRHEVRLEGLVPDTEYWYAVGTGDGHLWSQWAKFRTAPKGSNDFSFVYMGDAQNGLYHWGDLLRKAFSARPDARFYIMAGDLVDRGNERDNWDEFFHYTSGVFDRRPVVPVIGNHEVQGRLRHPTLYLQLFSLLENGPIDVEAERAYFFNFGNVLFVVMDSNLDPKSQSAWLRAVLRDGNATWKIVVYHHPAYSAAPDRDNQAIREHWVPIFDEMKVDLVLQGHDHSYLRTYPMRNDLVRREDEEGTVYVVSVSGAKMYPQARREYAASAFTQVSTYQILDIQIKANKLVYRAYDVNGQLKDRFELRQ